MTDPELAKEIVGRAYTWGVIGRSTYKELDELQQTDELLERVCRVLKEPLKDYDSTIPNFYKNFSHSIENNKWRKAGESCLEFLKAFDENLLLVETKEHLTEAYEEGLISASLFTELNDLKKRGQFLKRAYTALLEKFSKYEYFIPDQNFLLDLSTSIKDENWEKAACLSKTYFELDDHFTYKENIVTAKTLKIVTKEEYDRLSNLEETDESLKEIYKLFVSKLTERCKNSAIFEQFTSFVIEENWYFAGRVCKVILHNLK